MPDLPGGSSALPILYHTIWVTIGARWSGMTTTSMPLSSRKSVTLNSAGTVSGNTRLSASTGPVIDKASDVASSVPHSHSALDVINGSGSSRWDDRQRGHHKQSELLLPLKAAAKRPAKQSGGSGGLDEADDGFAIVALIKHGKAGAWFEGRRRRFLDHAERAGAEPTAGFRRLQGPLAQALAVGRIGEDQA